MNDKFDSNNIQNEEPFVKLDDNDYDNLINRLKDIRANIALLEKKYLNKF